MYFIHNVDAHFTTVIENIDFHALQNKTASDIVI